MENWKVIGIGGRLVMVSIMSTPNPWHKTIFCEFLPFNTTVVYNTLHSARNVFIQAGPCYSLIIRFIKHQHHKCINVAVINAAPRNLQSTLISKINPCNIYRIAVIQYIAGRKLERYFNDIQVSLHVMGVLLAHHRNNDIPQITLYHEFRVLINASCVFSTNKAIN